MGKNQHVTPHPDGGWQVKGAGNSRATVRTETQKEAIDIARDIARNRNLNFSFMEKTVGFVSAILMGMTRIRLKVN